MSTQFCNQCGATVAAGKRFCSRCGSPATQLVPLHEPALPNVPCLTEPATASPTLPPFTPAILPAPEVAVSQATARTASSESAGQTPDRQRPVRIWLATGVLLCAAAATGCYLWYLHTAGPPAKTAAVPIIDGPLARGNKPSPMEPGAPRTAAPVLPSTAAPTVQESLPDAVTLPDQSVAEPKPSKAPAPNVRRGQLPQPSTAAAVGTLRGSTVSPVIVSTGDLHYAGPPVPPGGSVVFSGLPGTALRLSFDHAAWHPSLFRQQDGTQTLVLRSLSQQEQARCDVLWELVP